VKLFGTDGLRGVAGAFPLDPASVRLVGREIARALPDGPREVILGGDTRESTPGMLGELAAGLSEGGARPSSAGVLPTPAVAELVLELSAAAGVSISASHNPWRDNGIKIFGPEGRKWPDALEEGIERALGTAPRPAAGPEAVRWTAPAPEPVPELHERYVAGLLERIAPRLPGLSVVLDAGNGAAWRVGPEAFSRAGARVTPMCCAPDGRNINEGCGALHPEAMANATRNAAAHLGVALDGDADRSIFADEKGQILDGDDVLWIVARHWKSRGRLTAGGVVGTVMSNFGLEAALAREEIAFHRSAVGDRHVARRMEETGAVVGGETSGHVLLPYSPAGDGIATALVLASILVETGEPLSALASLEKTPQVLRNLRVASRVPLETPEIAAAVARAEAALDSGGRVYLRYSGTEPLLRILIEGRDAARVRSIADEIEAEIRRALPSPAAP
jgi:phosphoglucosamine mutase